MNFKKRVTHYKLATGLVLLFLMTTSAAFFIQRNEVEAEWNGDTLLGDVLKALGDESALVNKPEQYNESLAMQGQYLFTTGRMSSEGGKQTSRQSRFFVCTDCHNTRKEDPDLKVSDPEARLDYAIKNNLAFLQGTTVFGTSNRESWYNGDYYKKYGDLVKPANHSLKEAIHLCATTCSQGRDFNEQEMQALLAYFWSISLKLSDLNLSEGDWTKLNGFKAKNSGSGNAITWLKSFYLSASPATFGEVPTDKVAGYSASKGDPQKGSLIYDAACGHCHYAGGPSKYLTLDNDPLTLKFLKRNIPKDTRFSLYEIIRVGTHSFAGHKAYMPHYTNERMSNQQVEDLRAFIEAGI